MPARKTEEKELAKRLYLRTDYSQKDIATAVGINERTMSVWVARGNWASLKRQMYNSPEQEIDQLYEELRLITKNIKKREPEQQVPTKEELDARLKLSTLIQAHLKNTPEKWRNVPLDIDTDLTAILAAKTPPEPIVEKIYVEEKFTPERLRDYYDKVANLLVKADASIGKIRRTDEEWNSL